MARRFPVVRRMLALGSLNLTSVRLLAAHLTKDNHNELLAAASGKSKRQVQELLARLFPQPEIAPSIRKLPAPRPTAESPATPVLAGPAVGGGAPAAAAQEFRTLAPWSPTSPALFAPAPAAPSRNRPVVTPLAPDRYQITFTASAETREKLQLAQDLLRHTIPSGDMAAIIDRALTALLEDLARQKFAATNRPRASRGTAKGSRDIPASVMRTVWVRDLGRCAFVSKDGRRCNERGFVEFHHMVPHGVGGPRTVSNVELRCRSHNAHEADLYYGPRASEGVVRETAAPYGNWRHNSVRTELRRRHSSACQRIRRVCRMESHAPEAARTQRMKPVPANDAADSKQAAVLLAFDALRLGHNWYSSFPRW
jgi:hypothetical protein